ncbi:sodium:proton antiporter [Methylocella sp.]|uniref:sodium:proton antiporter n=1 Tax=Methylocella sp. TaxID=1978226 RepID=UPI003783D6D2
MPVLLASWLSLLPRAFPPHKGARLLAASAAVFLCPAAPARAAQALDGAALPVALALPFAGLLLTIALAPLLAPKWWHARYPLAAAAWALASIAALVAAAGPSAAAAALLHVFALDYVPFILMLFALFTCAGGLALTGALRGSPLLNCAILALGAAAASVVGTTGAAMILIRPLIRANAGRPFNAHVVVFFIFLVANVGGALTPLGDPPLFLGFLHGVDFFWPARHLWPATLGLAGALLALFLLVDWFFARRDGLPGAAREAGAEPPGVVGLVNVPLIACVVAAIAASGLLRWPPAFEAMGVAVPWQNVLREGVMLAAALASLRLTPAAARAANGFDFEPIREVAILFAAIFACIVPVMAMLQAGGSGIFAPILALLERADGAPNAAAYFWATGLLSSLLDNAPTYLVFFELAGGDPAQLMGEGALTLAAISCGAVFMGALTYVGNAPNFMVYAIARGAGVKMPGFFGYMLWSGAILLPLFALVTLVFFRQAPA